MESTMRRVITRIYILIVAFTCTMMHCEGPEEYEEKIQIVLANKTSENIYPFIHCCDEEEDDIFPQYWWDITIIHPNDTAYLNPFSLSELERYGGLCKIYILGQTTFDKYSQKEIIEKCVYDKVYTFDYEDFEKNEFTISITYTGE